MSDFTISSEQALSRLFGDIREVFRQSGFVKGKFTTGRKRSLSQNDISHVWYEQIALELREGTALDAKCYCKLHHGVPILRATDSDYRATYDAVIRPLTYENKLLAMKQWPVTSLMTKAQISEYLEAVKADYDRRGVILEFPMERAA